jgi:cyclophilin family peptidyl-prolyl cis-trans isomerase
MSNIAPKTQSVSERRRQEEARRQKSRQRNIVIVSIFIGLAIIAVVVFLVNRDNAGTVTSVGTEIASERPLASMEPEERNDYFSEAPPMSIDTSKSYQALIRMESGGEMRLQLFDDEAPVTVNNFVFLANQGFFDGTTFHRVLNEFMAQGGDPSGTGSGGPGYQFEDETDNGLAFDRRGLLAMANAGPDTNGSQFFITFAPAPHLDGAHTIFGELVEGDEVLSTITLRDPATAAEPGDRISEIVIYEE